MYLFKWVALIGKKNRSLGKHKRNPSWPARIMLSRLVIGVGKELGSLRGL